MASADPALALASAAAEDPPKDSGIIGAEYDHPIAPDQFDPEWETDKWEIWSYYAYYIGNNGLSLLNFGPTAFQNLLYQAAGDGTTLRFAGRERTINSIVLLSNGISFAIQVVVFLFLGSFAAWGIGFGWLGVHDPSKWEVATGLYIVGLIAYQTTLTFWTAAFPGLARNTPELRLKAQEYQAGEITRAEYDYADTMKRSELANMSFYIQSIGELVILAVIVGILFGVNVDASTANNNWGLSVPPGMNIISVSFWQLYRALSQIWHLKQSLVYLIGYFLLGDSLNTTVTVIATLQNSIVAYNTLELTYLFIVGIACQAIGIYTFWWAQQRYKLSTKTMFNIVAFSIIILDAWGMIGIWTQRFGFHHVWEVWLYQVFYGLFVCPWYAYSQIMISEVTPRGREFLFFSLFSVIGKTSSFIGPLVSSAIIDASPHGNNSTPFYFLTGLSAASFLMLVLFVDLEKSRREQEEFLIMEEAAKNALVGINGPNNSVAHLEDTKA
ncbi:hypothetical protein B7494_g406 [Chlorociboria aeruginascens]|nr:hypothetical protein B7494_g406 [Chlorociboria aeruginascens]